MLKNQVIELKQELNRLVDAQQDDLCEMHEIHEAERESWNERDEEQESELAKLRREGEEERENHEEELAKLKKALDAEREKPKFSQQCPVQTKIVPIKDYHPVLEEKPLEFNPRTAPIKDWTADKLMAFLNTRLSKPQMILRSGSPNWWQLKTRWLEVWVRNRTSFYANGEQMRKGKPQRSGCQGPCTSRSPRPAASQGRV